MDPRQKSNETWKEDLEALDLRTAEIHTLVDPGVLVLLKAAIAHWGTNMQVLTAAEEATEYAHACIRTVARPDQWEDNMASLIDETADIMVMLAQMELVMKRDGPVDFPERVQERIKFKADRIRRRLIDHLETTIEVKE